MQATEDAPAGKKEKPAKEEKAAKEETPAKKEKAEAKKEVVEKSTAEEQSESTDQQAALLDLIGTSDEASKDDLKKLNGVGPAFEKKLNSVGVYTFNQVGKLDKKSIPLLEELIGKPGFVTKNDWLKQVGELTK
jgi:large subunit ribosomal protein L21